MEILNASPTFKTSFFNVFEIKDGCKVSCVEIMEWLIAVIEGANTLFIWCGIWYCMQC